MYYGLYHISINPQYQGLFYRFLTFHAFKSLCSDFRKIRIIYFLLNFYKNY